MDLNTVGVRVNMVSPTWVNTPMLDVLHGGTEEGKQMLNQMIKQALPIGRAADPDEVAAAILYLCGPDSAYVTGTNIMIDAGLTIGPSI
jgi:NAD(P)-dependent dehydrogenase (short-subunit alcohol dehydrogenase family)